MYTESESECEYESDIAFAFAWCERTTRDEYHIGQLNIHIDSNIIGSLDPIQSTHVAEYL